MFKLTEKIVLAKIYRPVHMQCVCSFSKEPGSQQIDEHTDTKKKPKVPAESAKVLAKNKDETEAKDIASESDLQYRSDWHKEKGDFYTYLRVFYSPKSKRSTLQMLEAPVSLESIKKWFIKKQVEQETILQSYIAERHEVLGNELAAAHFLVYRGGAIKFFEEDKWYKADEQNNYNLPSRFEARTIQAIDCSYMNLRYEGLENLKGLKNLEWLSLNGCRHIDDWCLDRIGNIFSHSLLYLDLRDCPEITERGIGALYKMKNLKILLLDELWKDTIYEMTCLLLQDVHPELEIRSK